MHNFTDPLDHKVHAHAREFCLRAMDAAEDAGDEQTWDLWLIRLAVVDDVDFLARRPSFNRGPSRWDGVTE